MHKPRSYYVAAPTRANCRVGSGLDLPEPVADVGVGGGCLRRLAGCTDASQPCVTSGAGMGEAALTLLEYATT